MKGKIWKFGDAISTDHIIPGRYFYLRSNLPELSKHILEYERPGFSEMVSSGDFIVAGQNFGLFLRKTRFQAVAGFPDMPIAEDLVFVRLVSKLGRIAVTPAHAVTSGRRRKKLGVLRTTLINQFILAGLALGISPKTLARLYR